MVFAHLPDREKAIFAEQEDSYMDYIEFVESFDKDTGSRLVCSYLATINDENDLTEHMRSENFTRRVA